MTARDLAQQLLDVAEWLNESAKTNPDALNVCFNKFDLLETANKLSGAANAYLDSENHQSGAAGAIDAILEGQRCG